MFEALLVISGSLLEETPEDWFINLPFPLPCHPNPKRPQAKRRPPQTWCRRKSAQCPAARRRWPRKERDAVEIWACVVHTRDPKTGSFPLVSLQNQPKKRVPPKIHGPGKTLRAMLFGMLGSNVNPGFIKACGLLGGCFPPKWRILFELRHQEKPESWVTIKSKCGLAVLILTRAYLVMNLVTKT